MKMKKIEVEAILGYNTNCYIIIDEYTKETIVVDPAAEIDKITGMLNILESRVKYIYLTHCHADHTGVAEELKAITGAQILIHVSDAPGLKDDMINLTEAVKKIKINLEPDSRVNDGDLLHIGDIELKVIHTPGHTCGSSCLYIEKEGMLFSGDTVFRRCLGRTDLPTSNPSDIIKSFREKIAPLPDNTYIYPGHGDSTILKEEREMYIK